MISSLRSRARRSSVVLLAAVTLGACMEAEAEPEAPPAAEASDTQDLISIGNLVALVRGKVDRSKPDPYNPWAKKVLAVGEENRLPEEDAEFLRIGKLVNRFATEAQAEARASKPTRTFHAKPHACVLGSLQIDNRALPEDAKVGLFAENTSYPTWTRFSNGVGGKQSDKKLDVRGLAFKIMGVPGERVLTNPGDETATTQDFLLANLPFAPHTTATTMMAFGEAMSGTANSDTILGKIENLIGVGQFLTSNENVRLVDFLANHALPRTRIGGSLLGETYFSGAPNALGVEAGQPATARAKGAIKLKVVAGVLAGDVCKPTSATPTPDADFLRKDLSKHFASERVCLDIFLQRQTSGVTETVEDVSVEWKTPFTKVGRITFEPRVLDPESPEQLACNDFSFQPWHTIAAHRPLGNAMRARRIALPSSAKFRGATATEPTAEPAAQ